MNEEVDSSLGLCGWFRKEKQDKKFKKPKLSTSNRRWFQIQKIEGELALCYYKRMPKEENDFPKGFFFLNDITSISQDIPKRLIMLEHPTRTLRMESPSLSQHKHSYSELIKYYTNARSDSLKEPTSHSFCTSAPLSTSTSVEENVCMSMSMDGTAANDELNGNGIALSTSSSDSGILDTSVSTTESEKENVAPEYEEEKTALEPLYYRGSGKHDDSEIFDMEQLNKELSDTTLVRHESLLSTASGDVPNRSASFGSHSHQIPTSSSFRLHFGDDDVQPDDDFLCDDWDD